MSSILKNYFFIFLRFQWFDPAWVWKRETFQSLFASNPKAAGNKRMPKLLILERNFPFQEKTKTTSTQLLAKRLDADIC